MLNLVLGLLALFAGTLIYVYLRQEQLIFRPDVLPDDFVFQFTTRFEELYLDVQGARLNAILFRSEDESPRGVVCYCHGNAGCLETWGSAADQFLEFGYDVLIYDYRGYGKSTGRLSEQALFSDAQAVYDYLKTRYSEDRITVFGRSIGSGIAAHLGAKNSPHRLVLKTPYYSLIDLGRTYYPWIPVALLLRYPLKTYEKLGEVKCPIFIIHGTNDEVIPYKCGAKLKALLKECDRFYTVLGAGHNELELYPQYHKALKEIFGD